MSIRHFLNTQDFSRAELDQLVDLAMRYKRAPRGQQMAGRSIALLFFNNSMRTRTSFELGAFQLGGHAVVLSPGRDAWGIEFEPCRVMDGEAEEHVSEVARVLSRYCDLIGVRAFPKFQDWSRDREDAVLNAFARHATVPVINLETITHPCQELAHVMALREHCGDLRGSKALTTLVTAAYAPPPGVLAIVWAAGGADASNVGLGGLSFTGTKPTSATLTLTVTVQVKANIATFVSSNGECRVTIGGATAKQVSGTFNCSNLSNGKDAVDITGSFNAQG